MLGWCIWIRGELHRYLCKSIWEADGIFGVDYIVSTFYDTFQVFLTLLAINLRQLVGFEIGDRNFEAGALISFVLGFSCATSYLASCHLKEYFLTVWIEVETALYQVHRVKRRELAHKSWTSDGFDFPLGFGSISGGLS